MPIRTDRSDLPAAADSDGTWPPDADPWVLDTLIGTWKASVERHDRHDRPVDAPYFASDSGLVCLRQLYYAMNDTPRDPMPLPQLWKVNLGTMVHQALEDLTLPENWASEVRFDLTPIGIPGRGRADLVVFAAGERAADHVKVEADANGRKRSTWLGTGEVYAVVDYMTQNGYGYKLAVTNFKGGPNGPSTGKVTQAALAAELMDADFAIVAHLAMEVLGPTFSAGRIDQADLIRFAAQWSVGREQIAALVAAERARVRRAIACRDAKVLPVRELTTGYPDGAIVADPEQARWEKRNAEGMVVRAGGCSWPCDYCGWRDKCVSDGDGDMPEGGEF